MLLSNVCFAWVAHRLPKTSCRGLRTEPEFVKLKGAQELGSSVLLNCRQLQVLINFVKYFVLFLFDLHSEILVKETAPITAGQCL